MSSHAWPWTWNRDSITLVKHHSCNNNPRNSLRVQPSGNSIVEAHTRISHLATYNLQWKQGFIGICMLTTMLFSTKVPLVTTNRHVSTRFNWAQRVHPLCPFCSLWRCRADGWLLFAVTWSQCKQKENKMQRLASLGAGRTSKRQGQLAKCWNCTML